MRRRSALDKMWLTKLAREVLSARLAWREAPAGGAEYDRLYQAYQDSRASLAWSVIHALIPEDERNASDGRGRPELPELVSVEAAS